MLVNYEMLVCLSKLHLKWYFYIPVGSEISDNIFTSKQDNLLTYTYEMKRERFLCFMECANSEHCKGVQIQHDNFKNCSFLMDEPQTRAGSDLFSMFHGLSIYHT